MLIDQCKSVKKTNFSVQYAITASTQDSTSETNDVKNAKEYIIRLPMTYHSRS